MTSKCVAEKLVRLLECLLNILCKMLFVPAVSSGVKACVHEACMSKISFDKVIW